MPVTPYGDSMRVQTWWRGALGAMSFAFFAPRYVACSTTDHSHSRLFMNPKGLGNVSLFSVVSIWKIFRPASFSTSPIRAHESWIALRPGLGSMYDLLCNIVCTLWWCFTLRYDARPT